jgi:Methyltransferase domain
MAYCYLESKYASNAPTLPPHLSRHGVTRALARTLAPEIRITATDLNQPMLDFAAAQSGASRVTWRQADALRLPFNEGFKFLVDGENGIIAGHAKDTGQRVFQNVGRSAATQIRSRGLAVGETTAAGRAKISVFGAHVGFLGELTLTLGFGRRIVNELLPRNGLPKENRAEGDGDRFRTGRLRELEGRCDG